MAEETRVIREAEISPEPDAATGIVPGRLDWWATRLFVVYLVLALVSPGGGGLGFGDVKLAGVLGLLLGWLGWGPVLVSVLAAFIVGGVIAVLLLLSRRASRSSHIAFGPSMILGAWMALMFPVMFPVQGLTG